MYSVLHFLVLCGHGLGLFSLMAISPFLEDVIYEPLRLGVITWPVAFECLLIYLHMIDSNPSEFTIANVFHKAGGIDNIRDQAKKMAVGRGYPAPFLQSFRTPGGNPGPSDIDADKDKDKDKYKGKVTDYDHSATKGCRAWNMGEKHLAKHVDKGVCKFLHKCDQWVTDKGKGGQCLGDHKRKDCDYDPSKRCSQPASQ